MEIPGKKIFQFQY